MRCVGLAYHLELKVYATQWRVLHQGQTAHSPTCKSQKCDGECMDKRSKKEGAEDDPEPSTEDQIDSKVSPNGAYASEEADCMLDKVSRACEAHSC